MFDIHITGNSLDEIADKALALGARLSGNTSTSAPAQPAPDKPKPAKAATQPKKEPEVEAAEKQEPAAEPKATTETPAKLDFHLHVAKAVTDAVQRAGRDAVIDTLSQFGTTKASDIPEAQWPELVAALGDLS